MLLLYSAYVGSCAAFVTQTHKQWEVSTPNHHLLQDALRVVSQVQATLGCQPLRPGQLTRLRQVQIPVGSKLVYEAENTVHDTSSIEVYLQVSNAVEALEHCYHSPYGST